MEKRKCRYYAVCRLYADADEHPPLCILHSKNPGKDKQLFKTSLEKHRGVRGDDFKWIFFPEKADFFDVTFSKEAIFLDSTFSKEADFSWATFIEKADFFNATFIEKADFSWATFLGKTTFIGEPAKDKVFHIFSGIKNEVNFRNVNVDPPEAFIFRDADLSKCLFEQTDLRKAEFTGVSWPKRGKRFRVYDEIRDLQTNETRRWDHIERVYRELKQNYEDRRDYERAGDFHYGEKEMRRKNPDTPPLHRWLLAFYWAVSGYGERYIRPLFWAFGLLVLCTCEYLILGISPAKGGAPLTLANPQDWLHVGLYSLQVMTLLRPADLVPLGTAATAVKVFQSLLGPIIIGLFALAVRQRLKR